MPQRGDPLRSFLCLSTAKDGDVLFLFFSKFFVQRLVEQESVEETEILVPFLETDQIGVRVTAGNGSESSFAGGQ